VSGVVCVTLSKLPRRKWRLADKRQMSANKISYRVTVLSSSLVFATDLAEI